VQENGVETPAIMITLYNVDLSDLHF